MSYFLSHILNRHDLQKSPLHTLIVCLALFITSCSTSKTSIVNKKYPAQKLQEDFKILQGALEESHPGLYWFTPKDQIDKVFAEGYNAIKDSMTERQFRTLLLKVITPHSLRTYFRELFEKILKVSRHCWIETISSCI